jgi:hypothetical protein
MLLEEPGLPLKDISLLLLLIFAICRASPHFLFSQHFGLVLYLLLLLHCNNNLEWTLFQ